LRRMPGRITVGVLIAQDIAIVPMLILVSSLGQGSMNVPALITKIVLAVGVLGLLLWWLGRQTKLKIPFDEQIGDSVELLALGSLAVCFGAAAIAGGLGLSPAYGAFLAGLIIGNSTLRTKVIPVIEPIQSILLLVFFLSIGLLIDLHYVIANIWVVLAASVLAISIKTVLNIFLLRLAGFDRETALIGGLSMAQIGEFSFVLAAAGFAVGALGSDMYRLVIAVTAVTLLLSPAWIAVMHRIEELATDGYASYKEALAEAYAEQIGSVHDLVWWVKIRIRAGRIARQKRTVKTSDQPADRYEKSDAKQDADAS
jgi:monovalent cation:H+ antiporter-2, CPA2 family